MRWSLIQLQNFLESGIPCVLVIFIVLRDEGSLPVLDGLFSMPLPELSEDEWIENLAEAGEEASLCTVGEGSDIAKGVQILIEDSNEVRTECEASDVNPVRYASDTLSHTKPEFLSLFAEGGRRYTRKMRFLS